MLKATYTLKEKRKGYYLLLKRDIIVASGTFCDIIRKLEYENRVSILVKSFINYAWETLNYKQLKEKCEKGFVGETAVIYIYSDNTMRINFSDGNEVFPLLENKNFDKLERIVHINFRLKITDFR